MNDAEFFKLLREACNGEHCPEDLVRMAETPFQKQVAVEFVLQDRRINAQGHDIKILKKLTWGIFTVTAVACVVQVVSSILPIL